MNTTGRSTGPAMTAANTLVVPVEVAALAVNDQTRITDGSFIWQRWQADFSAVAEDNLPPEPVPFTFEDWSDDPGRCGVYLQWQLPQALTRGRHDEAEGIGDFPLVPNRWLVVRRLGLQTPRTWLVHSDYLGSRDDGPGVTPGTVSYLDPSSGQEPKATFLGRAVELTQDNPWREPDDAREPFLTAIGSGLLTFAAFQPYNHNVFSLHDPLDDVTRDATLSYHVSGWYSHPGADIAARAGEESLHEWLDRLRWSAPTATSEVARTLYTGSVLNLVWQPGGPVPESDCPGPDNIAVCVGNSSAEAVAALPGEAEGVLDAEDSRLFRAFALGCLGALDRADGAGDGLVAQAAHDTGFGTSPGGFAWRVVDHDDAEARSRTLAQHRVREQQVVAELNRLQAEHDADVRALAGERDRLFDLWSLSQAARRHPDVDAILDDELDPDFSSGAAGRAAALIRRIRTAREVLPWGETPEELAADAAAYADRAGLRSACVLERVPAPPFHHATDPVVVLHGAHLNAPLTRGSALPCRPADRLVRAVRLITENDVRAEVRAVPTSGLPELLPAALTEFFILARARPSGPISAGDTIGAPPEYGIDLWRQPWQPLFLMWKASYTPLAYTEAGRRRWRFDGTRYIWDGDGDIPDAVEVMGRQILTPSVGHALAGQIDAHTAHRTDLPDDLVRGLRETVRREDLLAQSLDGFGAMLRQRDPRAGRRPPAGVEALIGPTDISPPVPGIPPKYPGQEWQDSRYHELRAGQLAFTRLSVVDRFGRAVNLIEDERHFTPVLPDTMIPETPVDDIASDRLIEFGPRLLQPARLRFDFLASDRDDDIAVTPGANPVCAWLLNNRLDRALACFDPDGRALGELRDVLAPDGDRAVAWAPLPGSHVRELEQLREMLPHTYAFLDAIRGRGPAVLASVRATVDAALTTIDPDGPADAGLGFLLGRPAALVRTRLDLELLGPVRTTVGWTQVADPPPPEVPSYEWFVRLGEPARTDDGLIGVVLNDDYTHLHTTIAPVGDHGGYLRPIPIDGEPSITVSVTGAPITATLLVDPRVPIHATTDILPTGTVHIPQEFTATALSRMAVGFRAGPLLAAEARGSALTPAPATATGTWTWSEPTADGWRNLPMTTPDPTAASFHRPQIRSGFLVLSDVLSAGLSDVPAFTDSTPDPADGQDADGGNQNGAAR
ncbi:hypothetical protein ACFPOI_60425 [Nonomuraea angiospora]|uniref:Uncharacterized protein n=1 Tax=Nonomuraea angiospora TaxID=46172 RepID=A0ABR9LQV4_9ACTN|nr:hypothetical protein [Nonomuraea angiospora]MBE1582670.1 hypothetical protein [Nonomuraea angiospora]